MSVLVLLLYSFLMLALEVPAIHNPLYQRYTTFCVRAGLAILITRYLWLADLGAFRATIYWHLNQDPSTPFLQLLKDGYYFTTVRWSPSAGRS